MTSRRSFFAIVLALSALVCAAVAAFGPAEAVRTTYGWPPSAVPVGEPGRLWYTPLLLVRHRPEAISAEIPCSVAGGAPAGGELDVLRTVRDPSRLDGLVVTARRGRVEIRIGDRPLTVAAPGGASNAVADCLFDLRLTANEWSLEHGPSGTTRRGLLETMPLVTGLYSELGARQAAALRVAVTTAPHAWKPTARQNVAWTLAALGIVASLLVAAGARLPRRWPSPGEALRGALVRAHPVDAVVALLLLVWWVFSPAYWDDGWVLARIVNYPSSDGFSHYYDALGVNLPLDFWLEWLQHWVARATTTILWLRVPVLVTLAALWIACRWTLARVARSASGTGGVAVWALGSAFIVGAFAWGMTLRPEPAVALLTTGVLACAVRFSDRPGPGPVAGIAVLVPLALLAHPAGAVSLASALAVSPALLRWGARHVRPAATIAMAGVALVLVLASIGSDLEQRQADARETSALGRAEDHVTWDETLRYHRLGEIHWATPMRRAAVALMALSLLSLVLRRRPWSGGPSAVPGVALALGLLLLLATPSKWPWHFGALMGLAAVAFAVEAARVRSEGASVRRLTPRPFVLIAALWVAAAWAWTTRSSWNPLDLRTLDWIPRFEDHVPLQVVASALPFVALLGLVLVTLVDQRRRTSFYEAPWRVASWTGPLLAVPLVAFTIGVLGLDALRTSTWTLTRQNLSSLRGDTTCGLADSALLARAGGQSSPEPLVRVLGEARGPTLVLPNLVTYLPCARLPRLSNGVAEVPRTIVTPALGGNRVSPVGYASSPFHGLLDLYALERLDWAGPNPPRYVDVFIVDDRIPGGTVVPASATTRSS